MSAQDKLLPVYLVVGPDELKRANAVRRLRSRVPAEMADFNLEEIDGRSVDDPAQLVSSLEMMPFGASVRVVIVRAAEELPKAASEALVSYLDDPNPECVLCLEAAKLAKNTRLYKAVDKAGKRAGGTSVLECAALKRWELPPYVQRLAGAHGATIDADAAEELVNRCGESTTMLDNQVAMLVELLSSAVAGSSGQGGSGAAAGAAGAAGTAAGAAAVSPRGALLRITRADVEANVAQVAEVTPWAFADAVCSRDVGRALALYHMMQKPVPVFLHSVLLDRIRGLICAQSLAARGQSGMLAKELGAAPWQVKNYAKWARDYMPQELCALLAQAATCERALKGSDDSETAFVRFVLAFAPARG